MSDASPSTPNVTDSLALALIESSDAPILLLDGALTIVAASASFSRQYGIDPATVLGHSMFALGDGEWDTPQLRSLLRTTLSGSAKVDAYEMDLNRPGHPQRRLVLTAHALDYGDAVNIRLLLSVSDVTDVRQAARLKEDLLREKAILFQELHHRVANSLQIIASVLMQSARRAPSAEAKGHLFDAHNRVMSVAALQRQLAASQLGDVSLRPYFIELCDSIAASMIHDHEAFTLKVEADEGVADGDVSVSLGLIVTELVINALKHAFPSQSRGDIVVRYKTSAKGWTLSVRDDGVGIAQGVSPAKAGLGTSIVEALTKQLGAKVSVIPGDPGTVVSIIHESVPAVAPAPIAAV